MMTHIVDEWYTRSLTEWHLPTPMQGERLGADELGDHCMVVQKESGSIN
jgi:hypothetical protein